MTSVATRVGVARCHLVFFFDLLPGISSEAFCRLLAHVLNEIETWCGRSPEPLRDGGAPLSSRILPTLGSPGPSHTQWKGCGHLVTPSFWANVKQAANTCATNRLTVPDTPKPNCPQFVPVWRARTPDIPPELPKNSSLFRVLALSGFSEDGRWIWRAASVNLLNLVASFPPQLFCGLPMGRSEFWAPRSRRPSVRMVSAFMQSELRKHQSSMLSWHERISLLPALSLVNLVDISKLIFPLVRGRSTTAAAQPPRHANPEASRSSKSNRKLRFRRQRRQSWDRGRWRGCKPLATPFWAVLVEKWLRGGFGLLGVLLGHGPC